MLVPVTDIGRVGEAHRRLLQAVATLTDDQARAPSLLPGWTVGHVLTHLARNADSHVHRAGGAARHEMVDQYPGGTAARDAAIEAGAGRPADALIDDVRRTARAVEDAWSALPAGAWSARTRDVGGTERPLFELPARRWQEVEVHLVDLDLGVTHRDWPDDFVREWLPRTRERLWSQLSGGRDAVRLDDPADELAWLYGRLRRPGLTTAPRWG